MRHNNVRISIGVNDSILVEKLRCSVRCLKCTTDVAVNYVRVLYWQNSPYSKSSYS